MLLDEADVFLEKRSVSDLQRNSLVSGQSSHLLGVTLFASILLIMTTACWHSTYSFIVFLRIVEYYRGILFLTTNRVGQFDDAFISRIHTVIHYENFSKSEQDRIWAQFFAKLEKERRRDIRIHQSARDYISGNKNLQKIEWNGRQIRNGKSSIKVNHLNSEVRILLLIFSLIKIPIPAFQTAVAFAEYRFMQTKPEDRYQDEASLEDQDFAKVCEMTIAFQEYMASVHGGDESKRARLERIRDDKFKEG